MPKKYKLIIYGVGLVALALLIAIAISTCVNSGSNCECGRSSDWDGDNKCETCGGYVEHKHLEINNRCVMCGKCMKHVDRDSDGR